MEQKNKDIKELAHKYYKEMGTGKDAPEYYRYWED